MEVSYSDFKFFRLQTYLEHNHGVYSTAMIKDILYVASWTFLHLLKYLLWDLFDDCGWNVTNTSRF